MILAAGLSPAWQQILLFDLFTVGEVNRAREAHWCSSGKVLNVGITLTHLGAKCQTLSTLGGIARTAIEREFAALGASLRTIPTTSGTRVCTTILASASATTTELVQNAEPVTAEEIAAFTAAYREEAKAATTVVLTGSLPPGAGKTCYEELLAGTSARAILDFRGPELLAALAHRPMVVKPNREELAATVKRDLDDDRALARAMQQLRDAGAQWVVVSDGKRAVWVAGEDGVFRLQPPAVETVVNPIGCGDALAAGMAMAIDRGDEMLDAVRYGMATAADRLRLLLPGRVDPARVAAIAERIWSERI